LLLLHFIEQIRELLDTLNHQQQQGHLFNLNNVVLPLIIYSPRCFNIRDVYFIWSPWSSESKVW